jgi:hypothetical protein
MALVVVAFAVTVAVWGLSKGVSPVSAAATDSANVGSAEFALSATATQSSGSPVTVNATGAFDGQSGEVTTDLSSAMAALGAPAGTSGQVDIRVLQENGDPVIYANAPALSAMIPGGASWVKLDLQTLGKGFGVDLNQLLGQGYQTPTDALDLLKSVGSVTTVGPETITQTVGGQTTDVSTTHYTADIDPTKVATQLASDIGGTVGQKIQDAVNNSAVTPAAIPVDVWIDGSGLVRRVVLDQSGTQDGQTGSLHLQLDIAGYGNPVNVTAPPSSDVFDATSFLSSLGSNLPRGSVSITIPSH